MKTVIFTDLDGTLLDAEYSFQRALPALEFISKESIPLILCTSKTKAEIEHIRTKLNNTFPFIAENGGGIFIPKGYFGFHISSSMYPVYSDEVYDVVKLGADYDELKQVLAELRETGFNIRGFGDMSTEEVGELTGLSYADAERAKARNFDEPFIVNGNSDEIEHLKNNIRSKGFRYTQGEFFHIMGESDKGRAVTIIKKLFEQQFGNSTTVALGDSPNDIEMLLNVDYPVVVQKKDGSYNEEVLRKVQHCIKADGIGPDGWNKALISLFKTVLC